MVKKILIFSATIIIFAFLLLEASYYFETSENEKAHSLNWEATKLVISGEKGNEAVALYHQAIEAYNLYDDFSNGRFYVDLHYKLAALYTELEYYTASNRIVDEILTHSNHLTINDRPVDWYKYYHLKAKNYYLLNEYDKAWSEYQNLNSKLNQYFSYSEIPRLTLSQNMNQKGAFSNYNIYTDIYFTEAKILLALNKINEAVESHKKGLIIHAYNLAIKGPRLPDDFTFDYLKKIDSNGFDINTNIEPLEIYQKVNRTYFAVIDHAKFLIEAQKLSSAIELLENIGGESFMVSQHLGKAYYLNGDFENALHYLNLNIDIIKSDYAYQYRGYSKMELGDIRGALEDLLLSLENDKKSDIGNVTLTIGNLYLKLNDTDNGCRYIRKAVDMNVTNALKHAIDWCQ